MVWARRGLGLFDWFMIPDTSYPIPNANLLSGIWYLVGSLNVATYSSTLSPLFCAAICYMLCTYAILTICHMPCAMLYMLYAICYMLYHMLHAICRMLNMYYAICYMLYAMGSSLYAAHNTLYYHMPYDICNQCTFFQPRASMRFPVTPAT